MPKPIISFFVFILTSFPGLSNAQDSVSISPKTQISLITCAPGSALFEAFGHSAIRVHDPETGLDVAFNYGVFDFDQPNFYLNFAKGYLRYQLGTTSFSSFLYQYAYYDRSVDEQVLNLNFYQKKAIYQYLHWNSLPQNREYYYDYFFDNCATKPRDVLKLILGDTLQLDYSFADTLNLTIRDLTDRYLLRSNQYAWGDLGIDLGLGAGIDRLAKPSEYVYQPEFLYLAFQNGRILRENGKEAPLIATTNSLYVSKGDEYAQPLFLTPALLFWFLFAVLAIASFFEVRQGKYLLRSFDLFFFTFLGILGLILLSIWLFTNHTAATHNWNIVWCWPTHVLIAGMFYIRKLRPFLQLYLIFTLFVNLLLLFFWTWVPQDLHEAFIPILLLIILRSFVILILGLKNDEFSRYVLPHLTSHSA